MPLRTRSSWTGPRAGARALAHPHRGTATGADRRRGRGLHCSPQRVVGVGLAAARGLHPDGLPRDGCGRRRLRDARQPALRRCYRRTRVGVGDGQAGRGLFSPGGSHTPLVSGLGAVTPTAYLNEPAEWDATFRSEVLDELERVSALPASVSGNEDPHAGHVGRADEQEPAAPRLRRAGPQ